MPTINPVCHTEINYYSQGHSEMWWRLFIRKCHVLGVVRKELKSIIKQSQHYGIQGVICKTSNGEAVIESGETFMVYTSEYST